MVQYADRKSRLAFLILVLGFFLSGFERGFKIPDAFANPLAQLRNLVDSKDQDNNHQDNDELGHSDMRYHTLPPDISYKTI